MRQAGLLGACGLVANKRLVDRPADDHIDARRLAEGLQAIDPAWVDIDSVVTNIVMLHIGNYEKDLHEITPMPQSLLILPGETVRS
jgi:threonine aldolase